MKVLSSGPSRAVRWTAVPPTASQILGNAQASDLRGSSAACATGNSGGFRQIRCIAWKEFGDRFRSGWVIACVMV